MITIACRIAMNILFKKMFEHFDCYNLKYREKQFSQVIVDLIEIICQQYFKHFRYEAVIYMCERINNLKLGNSILVLNTNDE